MIDLWGNVDPHVQHSIELLKEHEPPEGYYLAFSGGKDSIVCYDLCQKARVKFDAHYMRAMEPPELVYFIRKHYPDVQRHLPKRSMWQLIRAHGIPPLRTIRYCCSELKEIGGKGRVVVTGIRKAESSTRNKRKEVATVNKKVMVSPILNWTTEQVWTYIHKNELAYPSLYDEGWRRIGCILCPCSPTWQKKEEIMRWPKIADAYKRACVRAFDRKIAPTWHSGGAMFKWWISGKDFSKDVGQEELEW
jgi:phosphoadenosine phosphosulfate reductase